MQGWVCTSEGSDVGQTTRTPARSTWEVPKLASTPPRHPIYHFDVANATS